MDFNIQLRKRKKPKNRFIKTFIDFGESTSFHGVKYTVCPESTIFEKIFWACVVLAGICGAIYMTLIFWDRYTSNPIRITIQSVHTLTSIIPFPGVTICTAVRQDPRKVENFLKSLILPNNTSVEEITNIIPSLMGYIQQRKINETDIKLLDLIFKANNYTITSRIFRKIEPSCRKILLKCRLESMSTPCEKLFKTVLTRDGHCCTFNSIIGQPKIFKKYRTLFYDYQMGLSIILDPVTSDKIKAVSTFSSTGVKILLHSPEDYPGVSSTEKMLGTGTETFIRIMGTKLSTSDSVKLLTPTQRKCVFEKDMKLKYFSQYRDTNCGTECRMNQIYNYCKCIPFTFPQKEKPVCNITDIMCLSNNFNKISQSPSKNSKSYINQSTNSSYVCNCPAQCNDVFYDIQTSSVTLSNINYTVSNFYKLDDDEDITNKMVIHLYFGNHYQSEMLRDTITSTYYLLSSFGGVFSLFLGCSFLSILEIIYFFCIRIFTKY